jgi:hypothetical protein
LEKSGPHRFFRKSSPTATRSTIKMDNTPAASPGSEDMDLRGRIFTDLDRLAFALELEAADHLERGRAGDYLRTQERRLGVRLAQRLVSGVPADEVEGRMERGRAGYDRRLGLVGA